MKSNSLNLAKDYIERLYTAHPEAFDQPTDELLFRLYLTNYLGLSLHWFAEQRLKSMPYETFRRGKQKLVEEKKIKISDENMKKRHIEAEKTKQAVKTKVIRWEINKETNSEILVYERTI